MANNNIKNNKKYAGQVVDIPRSRLRISFTDRLKKMTDAEGDPYLNIFSQSSIYLISIFVFDRDRSLVANLPLKDMPLIKSRTNCAEMEIFQKQNLARAPSRAPRDLSAGKPEAVAPAFTKLKIGNFAGKTPGDLLLEAADPEKVKGDLLRQINFLKEKLAVYPQNQAQIDAIEDAIRSYDIGILEDSKPEGHTGDRGANGAGNHPDGNTPFEIYKTPIKHQRRKNRAGKNECYSILITCSPLKAYPYRIEVMNCYAPLGQLSSGIMPVLMDKAEGVQKESVDLTEAEWLYILECLDENTKNTKKIWYAEQREQDEANRWKG